MLIYMYAYTYYTYYFEFIHQILEQSAAADEYTLKQLNL